MEEAEQYVGYLELKSDHFGIEMMLQLDNLLTWLGLKSDHFGIEMAVSDAGCSDTIALKSDHFEIEMPLIVSLLRCVSCTKIRPFWD